MTPSDKSSPSTTHLGAVCVVTQYHPKTFALYFEKLYVPRWLSTAQHWSRIPPQLRFSLGWVDDTVQRRIETGLREVLPWKQNTHGKTGAGMVEMISQNREILDTLPLLEAGRLLRGWRLPVLSAVSSGLISEAIRAKPNVTPLYEGFPVLASDVFSWEDVLRIRSTLSGGQESLRESLVHRRFWESLLSGSISPRRAFSGAAALQESVKRKLRFLGYDVSIVLASVLASPLTVLTTLLGMAAGLSAAQDLRNYIQDKARLEAHPGYLVTQVRRVVNRRMN